ncbi:MAG UNVERIFIED_CONTAM: hypothetical protein LVR18_14495 [Planctomycetaceae bacterium]
MGAEVQLSAPAIAERIDRGVLNTSGRLALLFLPTDGSTVSLSSILDSEAEFLLAGAGCRHCCAFRQPRS